MDEEAHGQVLSRPLKFLDWINPCGNRRHDAIPEKRQTCPEYKAGFFSLLTFSWMSSLMAVSLSAHISLKGCFDSASFPPTDRIPQAARTKRYLAYQPKSKYAQTCSTTQSIHHRKSVEERQSTTSCLHMAELQERHRHWRCCSFCTKLCSSRDALSDQVHHLLCR